MKYFLLTTAALVIFTSVLFSVRYVHSEVLPAKDSHGSNGNNGDNGNNGEDNNKDVNGNSQKENGRPSNDFVLNNQENNDQPLIHGNSEDKGNNGNQGGVSLNDQKEKIQHVSDHDTAKSKEVHTNVKLTGTNLNSCLAKESEIKNRLDSLVKYVANMERVFDAIALRVEEFYANQTNQSTTAAMAGFSSYISDIQSKKDLIASDLTTAQNDVLSFSCTGTDPKGYLNLYRTDMQTIKGDLQDYRTSIRNLIKAIKPDVESQESSESTQSSESDN